MYIQNKKTDMKLYVKDTKVATDPECVLQWGD